MSLSAYLRIITPFTFLHIIIIANNTRMVLQLLQILILCSIIQSFETIATNLVTQVNFMNLTVIERNVTFEARRV